MDYTVLIIGLGIILAVVIIGKILKIVTKILITLIVLAIIITGGFFVYKKQLDVKKSSCFSVQIVQ